MMNKKISPKGILLILYLLFTIFAGIIFVPAYEIWGPEKNIYGIKYTSLFNLFIENRDINGFTVFYEIDFARLIYTIGIVTLIACVIWLVISIWEKEDQEERGNLNG